MFVLIFTLQAHEIKHSLSHRLVTEPHLCIILFLAHEIRRLLAKNREFENVI